VSIVSYLCTYCFPETTRGKITRFYSRFCAVAFFYVHMCELSYIYPGHVVDCIRTECNYKYRIGCVRSGLVLAKAQM